MGDVVVKSVGEVTWEFSPYKKVGGALKISIPVSAEIETYLGLFSTDEKAYTIPLNFTIIDPLFTKRKKTDNSADPFYATVESPYQYRVDVKRHRKTELGLTTAGHHETSDGKNINFKPHVTVSVQVFALSGVKVFPSIQLPGMGNPMPLKPLRQTVGRLTIDISIIVVQDRNQMPEAGLPIEPKQLFPLIELDNDGRHKNDNLWQGINRITVRYSKNSIEFTWLAIQQTLKLELGDPRDGISGFAFHFNTEPDFPIKYPVLGFGSYDDLLHIRVCGNVKVSLSPIKNPLSKISDPANEARYYRSNFVDPVAWATNGYPRFIQGRRSLKPGSFRVEKSIHRPLREARFFRIEKVDSLVKMPSPHTLFKVQPDQDMAHKDYLKYYTVSEFPVFLKLALDLGIGFIPIIGDFVDYAEFNYMMATGKDRWGKDASDTDIYLAGISAIPVFGTFANAARVARRGRKGL